MLVHPRFTETAAQDVRGAFANRAEATKHPLKWKGRLAEAAALACRFGPLGERALPICQLVRFADALTVAILPEAIHKLVFGIS